MANYPSYNILLDSSMNTESEYEDDFSQPGVHHSRRLRSTVYYNFAIVHQLSLADFNTLHSFYQSNPRSDITLSWFNESPVVTYTVKFTEQPRITRNLGADEFLVSVGLRGTKD